MTLRRALGFTFAIGAIYLAAMLWQTGGRPSMPVDDSFIYFQYAKQAAAGEPLRYQPGDDRTTGSTSLPWMALLCVGALLGFGGKAMVFFGFALGGIALALTAWLAARTQDALAPRKPGSERPGELPIAGVPLAAALVLLSGPLHWGAWSGMEIPLTALAIAFGLFAFVRAGGKPTPGAAVALALLGTVRPEGALLAVVAAGVWLVNAALRRDAARLGWIALPLAGAGFQPLVYWLATGSSRSTGFVAKSLLAGPGANLVDVLRTATLRAASLGAALFGGIGPRVDGRGLYAYDSETVALWVAPGALLLFLGGLLPAVARELRDRRLGPGVLSALWLGAVLFATCLIEEPDAHYSRYQMPILPVFLVWVAMGVGRLARVLRQTKAGLDRIELGLRAWLAVTGIASVLFFAAAYGHNCRDIDGMQIRLGESLRDRLGPGESVAINDAGAIAYFSGRPTLDLIGLTTPGFAGLWSQGTGVLWEKLEGLPAARRPAWFCIFPNWFEFEPADFLRRVGSVRLLAPSIVDAEKVLYRADWTAAGSGDLPRAAGLEGGGFELIDRLDVADPDSEAAHAFRWSNGPRGGDAGSFLRRAPVGAGGDPLTDGGRSVFGEVEFELARAPFARTVVLARTVTGLRQLVHVSVDGGPESRLELYEAGSGRWLELPLAEVGPGPGRARVRVRVEEAAAESSPLVLAHVFAVAERPE